MERQQALRILNSLANGVHPATGEVFAADSAYQHPDTVRALFEAVRFLDRAEGDGKRDLAGAVDHLRTMDRGGGGALAAGFDTGKTSAELAKLHNRSRAAIEARLLKLGKIDVSGLTVQLRYRGVESQ